MASMNNINQPYWVMHQYNFGREEHSPFHGGFIIVSTVEDHVYFSKEKVLVCITESIQNWGMNKHLGDDIPKHL